MKKTSMLTAIFLVPLIICGLIFSTSPIFGEEETSQHKLTSEEMTRLNQLALEMDSVLEIIQAAIERNPEFRDPQQYPQQLGELIVRSKSALSSAEEILEKARSSGLKEDMINGFLSARNGLEALHRYFLGLIDGKSKDALWEGYLDHIKEYQVFLTGVAETRAVLALEKGLVFDFLAELKARVSPALSANADFLTRLNSEDEEGKIYIAAKNAFDSNMRIIRSLRDLKIPLDVSASIYEELMQLSSDVIDYCLSMRRATSLYLRFLDSDKDPLLAEMEYFVKKAEETINRVEQMIRTIKGEF